MFASVTVNLTKDERSAKGYLTINEKNRLIMFINILLIVVIQLLALLSIVDGFILFLFNHFIVDKIKLLDYKNRNINS